MATRAPRYLVWDIETIPDPELAPLWEPTAAKEGDEPPMAPIWAHRIVAIGMLPLGADLLPTTLTGFLARPADEAGMIAAWAGVVTGGIRPLTLIDFNGRGFDMPVVQSRALHHGISLSWFFGLLPDNRGGISQWSKEYRDRYGGEHLDLRDFWTNRGGFAATKLEHLARLMGLPGKIGLDGSQVHAAWQAGRCREIDAYCLSDVYTTALVFARIWLIAGKISRAGYLAAAGAILDAASADPSQREFVAAVDRSVVFLEEGLRHERSQSCAASD